jgi:hypothetical protein
VTSEKDKTKLIGFSVFTSITSLIILNVFLVSTYESLMTIENFDYELASRTVPVFVFVMFVHYASMAIGLVASFHSQSENDFRDLSKPYLAYLAYLVFIYDVGVYAWKNWT